MEEKERPDMETLKFALQGMTKLDRSKFVKTLRMPYLKVPAQSVGKIVGLPSILNNTIKKEEGLKPIMDSADNKNEKLVLFNYDKLRQNGEETTRSKIVTELKAVIGDEAPSEFGTLEKEVMYEKWSVASCLKAVLPPGLEFKGFSQIGHIAHLNLKEEILPYRFVIGELIHDKLPNVKTVVNKTDKINNEFRVFDMELLAGEPKYETETAENGLRYKMDFSKVFWNPRLSNIHERIVKKFDKDSVVFDITSGIGPFVLPAVKQRNIRKAFANDLNPLSIDYLKENIKLNKISVDKIETFVMDAADFIRDVIPEQYSKIAESDEKELACNNEISGINFHAIMNLPALSLTFLPIFRGLLRHHSKLRAYFQSHPFWIHCHFFVKASADEEDEWYRNNAECFVRDTVKIPDMILQDVHYLRIVAPRKQMYCVSFQLPEEYAFSTESVNTTEINNKRKLDGDSESNELSKMLRSSSRLLSQYMGRSIVKEVESRRNASTISLHAIARKYVETSVNRCTNDRVNWLGPDLACLEWLMNCGATSVKMSNGEIIRSSQQMRNFIAGLGFQLSGRIKASKVPHTELVKKFSVTTGEGFSVDEDANYDETWKHLPPIYIDEVDASDSVIADPGFLYFTQCRQIKVMKLNYCDYFGDLAIRELALGRPSMTVTNLEIIGNFLMTEASIYWLSKMHALKRLHFYSLAFTAERQTILRQCRLAMPKCEVSFPAVNPKGLGYENVSNPMDKLMSK